MGCHRSLCYLSRDFYLLWTCSLSICVTLWLLLPSLPSNKFKIHLCPLLFFLFLPISCNLHMQDKYSCPMVSCFSARPACLWFQLAVIITPIFLPLFHLLPCLPTLFLTPRNMILLICGI